MNNNDTFHCKSINQLHEIKGWGKPKHPLVSLVEAEKVSVPEEQVGAKYMTDMYMISLKDKGCGMEYGRNTFDFDEGVMIFTAPKQIVTITRAIEQGEISGWMLYFHPDLIHGTYLGENISEYSFFNYDVYEALHLSDEEEKTVLDCFQNIKREYEQRIDNHSQRVIVSNLELLLNYCMRYYERQFNTRKKQSTGVVSQFEKELKKYFATNQQEENGLPSIQYFAERIHLSTHYLSDLLKKETGRAAKDHINDFVIEKAKGMLLSGSESISEVAYNLGFNYPHYFTRLFKSKTGHTPVEYRSLN
ncbi:MAG: helix-turn-helix transcriptional regulator [Bacteroidota bacterium]